MSRSSFFTSWIRWLFFSFRALLFSLITYITKKSNKLIIIYKNCTRRVYNTCIVKACICSIHWRYSFPLFVRPKIKSTLSNNRIYLYTANSANLDFETTWSGHEVRGMIIWFSYFLNFVLAWENNTYVCSALTYSVSGCRCTSESIPMTVSRTVSSVNFIAIGKILIGPFGFFSNCDFIQELNISTLSEITPENSSSIAKWKAGVINRRFLCHTSPVIISTNDGKLFLDCLHFNAMTLQN